MRRNFTLPLIVILLGLLLVKPGQAQPSPVNPFVIYPDKELPASVINKMLKEFMVETKDFQKEQPLGEFLKNLRKNLGAEGQNLGFIVQVQQFRDEVPDAFPILETPVRLPDGPQKMSLAACLEAALSKISNHSPQFLVKRGYVEITTFGKAGGIEAVLRGYVGPQTFQGPLEDVLDELADLHGSNIILDARVKEKAKSMVKAKFLNKVELETALSVLTDQAGLRWVVAIDSGKGAIYVTTEENAKVWMQKLRSQLIPVPEVKPASGFPPGHPGLALHPTLQKLLEKLP